MAFAKATLTSAPTLDLEFITEVQVAEAVKIPVRTLQGWRVHGCGPPYRKFGASVRYNVGSLRAWVESLPSGGAGIPSSAVSNPNSRRPMTRAINQ